MDFGQVVWRVHRKFVLLNVDVNWIWTVWLSQRDHYHTPAQRSWMGYTDCILSVRLSVRLWTESLPLCIFYNTRRIHFIFTHVIKQLQKVCPVVIVLFFFCFFSKSNISSFGKFIKFATLTLSYFHLGFHMNGSIVWVNHGAAEGILRIQAF